jgi:hypothetical protein
MSLKASARFPVAGRLESQLAIMSQGLEKTSHIAVNSVVAAHGAQQSTCCFSLRAGVVSKRQAAAASRALGVNR